MIIKFMRLRRTISDESLTPANKRLIEFDAILEAAMGPQSQILFDNFSSVLQSHYRILKEGLTAEKHARLYSQSEPRHQICSSIDLLLKEQERKVRVWQLIIEVNRLLFDLVPQFTNKTGRPMDRAFDALSSETVTFLLSLLRLFKNYIAVSDQYKNQLYKTGESRFNVKSMKELTVSQKYDCLNALQRVFQSLRERHPVKITHLLVNRPDQTTDNQQDRLNGRIVEESGENRLNHQGTSLLQPKARLGATFLSSGSEDEKMSEKRLKQIIEDKGWRLQRFGKEKANRANEILKEVFYEHIARVLSGNDLSATAESKQSLWLRFRDMFIKVKRLIKRQNHLAVFDIRKIAAESFESILRKYYRLEKPVIQKACEEFADGLITHLKILEDQ